MSIENKIGITVYLHPWVYATAMGFVREGRSLDTLVQEALIKQIGMEGLPLSDEQAWGTREKAK